MPAILIRNGIIVNEGASFHGDILIENDRLKYVGFAQAHEILPGTLTLDARGMYVLPGIIDDQVHFRQPGLTHKADILSETRAAAAGGVTSFMDMPNTIPQTVTIDLLEEKYNLGRDNSLINYSFYIGGTNNNLAELLNTDAGKVCGIKLFLGSSTGNMLVNDEKVLRELFSKSGMLIACHCEDEKMIKLNQEKYRGIYGEDIPVEFHPLIRSREACFLTSSWIAGIAKQYNTRLNILHLSTADELRLFTNSVPVEEKRIYAEVCVHHLWFEDKDYNRLGNFIKWNPAIKTSFDRDALLEATVNDLVDIIATDHAPHTIEEKSNSYFKAPSGGPLIQHSLSIMMELVKKGKISIEKVVEKMCHNPAIIYRVKDRGFLREGYKADICIVNPSSPWSVQKDNILYKCGWSPFINQEFSSKVVYTIVNGNIIYNNGILKEDYRGERMEFNVKN